MLKRKGKHKKTDQDRQIKSLICLTWECLRILLLLLLCTLISQGKHEKYEDLFQYCCLTGTYFLTRLKCALFRPVWFLGRSPVFIILQPFLANLIHYLFTSQLFKVLIAHLFRNVFAWLFVSVLNSQKRSHVHENHHQMHKFVIFRFCLFLLEHFFRIEQKACLTRRIKEKNTWVLKTLIIDLWAFSCFRFLKLQKSNIYSHCFTLNFEFAAQDN